MVNDYSEDALFKTREIDDTEQQLRFFPALKGFLIGENLSKPYILSVIDQQA